MKTINAFVASVIVLGSALSAAAVEKHIVRSAKPAADDINGWERESYPIGNGWFGVNVFGGVESERLQVTENSVLTKRNLANALDIRLKFKSAAGEIAEYSRTLELETGIARVEYKAGGIRFTRECFTSCPDRVLAVRLESSEKGALSFSIAPEVPFERPFEAKGGEGGGRAGKVVAKGRTVEVTQHLQWNDVRSPTFFPNSSGYMRSAMLTFSVLATRRTTG